MNVKLLPNPTREHVFEATRKLIKTLETLGINYDFLENQNDDDYPPDLIIAIGGDGTMIRAAKYALRYDIPVLGVNAGNLAFLMGLESDETGLLGKLLTKDYTIEERPVLNLKAYDEHGILTDESFLINDAVFARGEAIKLSSFSLYCDDRFINNYKADGLITATPTGSTAYNLAAGGPIVDPKVECIILSPICPHSLSERTILFSLNSVIKIANPGNDFPIYYSCDGGDAVNFGDGCFALIKRADKKSKFLRLKDDTFLDILGKKMKSK